MKRAEHLAPSTITHRHGVLAKHLDWMIRKHPDTMAANPRRLLKRRFSRIHLEITSNIGPLSFQWNESSCAG